MNWRLTAAYRPEEGETVYTKIEDYRGVRNECRLKYSNGMFWDGDMYVYYTPTHWGRIGC